MATQRRRRRVAGPIWDEIERLVELKWTPAQIHEELEAKFKRGVPTLRTVQRIVNELMPDPTKPWHLGPEDEELGHLVLPVLADVITESEGRKRELSLGEARWIARIRRVAPELNLMTAYRFAQSALRHESQGRTPNEIEHVLAFAPWRSDEADARLSAALTAGWVEPVFQVHYAVVPAIDETGKPLRKRGRR